MTRRTGTGGADSRSGGSCVTHAARIARRKPSAPAAVAVPLVVVTATVAVVVAVAVAVAGGG